MTFDYNSYMAQEHRKARERDEEIKPVIGKTIQEVERTEISLNVLFTDGSTMRLTSNGAGEHWLTTLVAQS